jgi:hypothetical protein
MAGKITELAALAGALAADDLVEVVTDPAGTPTNRKATIAQLLELAQADDTDLAAIAALVAANDDVIQRKAGAWTNRTIAQLAADLRAVLDGTYAVDQVQLPATFDPVNATGATTLAQNSGRWLAIERFRVSGVAQNDVYDFDLGPGPLRAGTWRLDLYHLTFASRGIYTMQFADVATDGTVGAFSTLGTIDAYAASGASTQSSLTGLAIATTSRKRLRFLLATKNASSSDYTWQFSQVLLRRTGA